MSITITHFAARCGDHNDLAMKASPALAEALRERLSADVVVIGTPEPALSAGWEEELAASRSSLHEMADHFDVVLQAGRTPVTALSRCAVALATLPVVAKHHGDAVVVWFDAHADLNTPANTTTGYLGGLALSGVIGLWDSGLGHGLRTEHLVLVGSRDLDEPEQRLVDDGVIALVAVGQHMAEDLSRFVAGRPVYVHIDCDVLDPGVVPTDYQVSGGMTLAQLAACSQALSESPVVGLEIGELEADRTDTAGPDSPARRIVAAVEPLLAAME